MLVLNHENDLRSSLLFFRRCGVPKVLYVILNPRQMDFKCRALAGFAVNPDVPSALLDESINRGQAQPSSLTLFLSGEKRFKDMGLSFGVHPTAGVGKR